MPSGCDQLRPDPGLQGLPGTYAIDACAPMTYSLCMADEQRAGITVVETRAFQLHAKSRLSPDEIQDLITAIASSPESGAVMKGTGGIRKVRFAKRRRGKSGSVRVIYYYHSDILPVFLLTVFAKNEKANLTKTEQHDLKELTKILVTTYGVKP